MLSEAIHGLVDSSDEFILIGAAGDGIFANLALLAVFFWRLSLSLSPIEQRALPALERIADPHLRIGAQQALGKLSADRRATVFFG